jgi:biopolymer transport protein ExbB/TolQ
MNLAAIRFWLEAGGATAWIIIFAFVVLIVTGLERLNFLFFKFSFNAEDALESIRQAVLAREYTKAIQICNAHPGAPDLIVVKAGLLAMEHGREAMKSSLGGAVLEVQRACEKRVPLLALIAGVSTLLGLLGTISGLIKTFAALAVADASQKAMMLGNGISEAMYSTAAGLALGIVAMVVYTLCTSKGDDIVGQAQGSGYKLVTWVEESERAANA